MCIYNILHKLRMAYNSNAMAGTLKLNLWFFDRLLESVKEFIDDSSVFNSIDSFENRRNVDWVLLFFAYFVFGTSEIRAFIPESHVFVRTKFVL